ncbi:flavodoxin FldB [Salmonella enterica subsp. enterica]|uniref:Flavodoxin FldB n=1 Tax=Salmonella enterica I TaxID=59201 RepID=A0A3S4IZG6_SALET|nr:flavodoxin FldB [Salmonella enterica subsp. enterica]
MGDQLGYGEWFLDALGMLHDKLALKGVKFVGYWPTEGYEFTSNKPVIADGATVLSAWRWMKRTSTISAMSVYRPGVNKFSAKWPNTTPEALLAVFPSRRNRVYAVPSVLA